MLWDEYIERCPEGYRYSRFCELYRGWASRLSVTMRQAHIGGDKLFVDYAGDTVPVIVDRLTGQVRPAQIFVAVMGASNFTYAEASWTQARWLTGSAPIPEPSRRSAACPSCWCRTIALQEVVMTVADDLLKSLSSPSSRRRSSGVRP